MPIQYALTYPNRLSNDLPRLNFAEHPTLTFEEPDMETFPCLRLAYEASREGGCMPCVLNAANEVAVSLFLRDKIGFYDIPRIIENAMAHSRYSTPASVEEYLAIDKETKETIKQSYKD